MLWLRLLYIGSLILLGVLLVGAVFRPTVSEEKYAAVERSQLLERQDGWVVQVDLLNREKHAVTYTIQVDMDGANYSEEVLVGEGRIFSYIRQISGGDGKEGMVKLRVLQEGQPAGETTYFLGRSDGNRH